MIQGIAWLLGFQLVGETIAYLAGGSVPGPVIGMGLLAVSLLAARRVRPGSAMEETTGTVADGLLAQLGILFVPAGVGIIQHLDIVAHLGLPILLAVIVSTVATLVVTVWVFVLVKRLEGRRRRG